MSLRLVQYYFGTKEKLLLAAMQHLAAQFGERARARIKRIKETENPVNPGDIIAAILTEALPADDERRTFTVLYTAYFALSLTEPALAIAPLVRNSNAVINVVAAQLRAAQAAGDAPAHLDPDLEAVSLLAMSAGLGTSVLGGQSSVEQAQAVIDYHLYRWFPRPGQRYAGAHKSTARRAARSSAPARTCRRHDRRPGTEVLPTCGHGGLADLRPGRRSCRPAAGAEVLPTLSSSGFGGETDSYRGPRPGKTGAGPPIAGQCPRAGSRPFTSRLICRAGVVLACGSPFADGVVIGHGLSFKVADFRVRVSRAFHQRQAGAETSSSRGRESRRATPRRRTAPTRTGG